MRTKVVAFESANSFVKVFSDGRKKVYPNTVTRATKEAYNFGSERNESTVYTVLGGRYNVGQTLDYISSSSDSIERYGAEYYYIESLIAISQFAKDGDRIKAVTGLPSIHYGNKEEATRLIQTALTGDHELWIDGEHVRFTITEVLVTLQPLATFFYAAVDEFGEESPEMMARFDDSETLIIDIGWGTTDVALCRGYGLVDYWTINTSMKTAYERIVAEMRAQAVKEKRKLASAKMPLLDVEKQLRKNMKYNYANEDYNAREIYDEVMSQTAKDIITEVNGIRGIDSYRTVLLTGGGTKALHSDLQELLMNKQTGNVYDNVYIIDDMQLANVKGYYVFAKFLQTV